MQLIADKIARIAAPCRTAGITGNRRNHLLHGTGGSPRRAKRAIRYGIADWLADLYQAVFEDTHSHAKATQACDKAWDELMAGEFDAEPSDECEEGEALQAAPLPLNAPTDEDKARRLGHLRKSAELSGFAPSDEQLAEWSALPLTAGLDAMAAAHKAAAH